MHGLFHSSIKGIALSNKRRILKVVRYANGTTHQRKGGYIATTKRKRVTFWIDQPLVPVLKALPKPQAYYVNKGLHALPEVQNKLRKNGTHDTTRNNK